MEWNERLKQARKLRRWTQDVLAEKLGTNRSTISRWEQGSDFPYPVHREKLTELLGAIFDDVKASAVYQNKDSELSALVSGGEQARNEYHTSQTLLRPGVHAYRAMHSLSSDEHFSMFSDTDAQSLGLRREIFKPSASQSLVAAWTEHVVLADPAIPQTQGYANSLLGRQDLIKQVKEHLLAGEDGRLIALHGLPGVGKTALAVALATDEQVQAEFSDGVLWAGLGRQPDMLGQLARWGKLLGVLPSQVEDLKSRGAWKRALRAAIGNRRFLLVIDDVCRIEDALALQIGGPQCTYLLTTHLSQTALTFASQETLLVPPLQESEGLALLARFAPRLIEHDPQGAQALVQALGCLPLALTLMGNTLASQACSEQLQPLQTALEHLDTTKQHIEMSISTASEHHFSAFAQSTPLFLQAAIMINIQQLSQQAHAVLCALALFPSKLSTFSKETALAVSQQPEILEELVNAGLLENWGLDCYVLHQTVANYARVLGKTSAVQKLQASSLVEYEQPYQQDMPAPGDQFFSPLAFWDVRLHHKRRALPFRAFHRLSWSLAFFVSTILLATLAIFLILPAFNHSPLPRSVQSTNSLIGTIVAQAGKTYEAEAQVNTLVGSAMVDKCSFCSGSKRVRYLGVDSKRKTNGALQFNNVKQQSAGTYKLTIYYLSGRNHRRDLYISVNSGPVMVINAPTTGDGTWNAFGTISTTVHLNAGNNTITLYNPSSFAPDIDRIVV